MGFSFFKIAKMCAKPKMLKMEYKWTLGDLGGQNINFEPYVYY